MPPHIQSWPEQEPPLLSGPDEVTEGYYELEALEWEMTREALRQHREPVEFWYRALTLYCRGMLGEWNFTDVETDKTRMAVCGLQSKLLGLGVSSTKAALDMLLAGYYSIAFASIRHMLETFVQYVYVGVRPEEVMLWYKNSDAPDAQTKTPGCRQMVDFIKQQQDLESPAFFDRIYDAWSLMSKGTHPTGQGIYQTVGDEGGKAFVFGATYHRNSCLVGFDHGLFATMQLLTALVGLCSQDDEWKSKLTDLQNEIDAWRESLALGTVSTA